MAKGPTDIGEESMALDQEDMASGQEATEPSRQPHDRRAAEIEATRLKEQETWRRNCEKRMEKRRLAAPTAEEQRLKQRKRDEEFMRETSRQVKRAAAIGDVPIGYVIVCGDRTTARGYNRRNAGKSVLPHAEITSTKKACKKIEDWRLKDRTMCVTLEPRPMCAGVAMQAHILRVAVGCTNPKADCTGSVLDMLHVPGLNHQAEVAEGVLKQKCSELMSDLLQNLRGRKKK